MVAPHFPTLVGTRFLSSRWAFLYSRLRCWLSIVPVFRI